MREKGMEIGKLKEAKYIVYRIIYNKYNNLIKVKDIF